MTAKHAGSAADFIRAGHAARIAAMFARWSAEDVSDEPDWDIDQLERIAISSPPTPAERSDP